MTVTWPQSAKSEFGKSIISATHDLHENEMFSDEGLAALLDAYPREDLGIWTFGQHGEGEAPAIRGGAPNATGAEIMEAVNRGTIWLNLRESNKRLPQLQPFADEVFGTLQSTVGRSLMKKDMGLLISSPKVHVHYHLDIPLVALFQLRGQKRIWLYPADDKHAPTKVVEDMVHMLKEEGLPFEQSFDEQATIIDLKPGMGITWPQASPHRVQNENCVNVSLSCEHMTMGSLINANAIYTNALIRKRFKMDQRLPKAVTPTSIGKAAIARAHKLVARKGPRKSPTPVTFELDTREENCVRPL